ADHARVRRVHEHAHRVPRRVHPRPAHAPGQSGRFRLGGRCAVGRLSALQGLQAGGSMSGSVAERLAGLDWPALGASLDEWGYARTPPLLTAAECVELRSLYHDESRFRSRVDMARFRFGIGEYKYLADPLPPLVAELREHAYPSLAVVANRWEAAFKSRVRHPPDLARLLALCARRGQSKPTPLLPPSEPPAHTFPH